MTVVLCSSGNVGKPYYIRELNVNIYSYEELCYIIYEHPLLAREDLICDELISFIASQLGLDEAANNLVRMYKNRAGIEDALIYMLEFGEIYNKKEIDAYKKKLLSFRDMQKREFYKIYGDYMFSIGKYGKAIYNYENVLNMLDERAAGRFISNVYNNLAAAYANMFYYEKAYYYYKLAFDILRDKNILKKMFFCSKLGKGDFEPDIEFNDVTEWEEELEEKRKNIFLSDSYREVERIFEYDKHKKKKMLNDMIEGWKQEYRRMI